MRSFILKFFIAASFAAVLTGCPDSTPSQTCNPASCASGCCSASGACVTVRDATACGLNGSTCSVCTAVAVCNANGACVAAAIDSGVRVDAGALITDAGSGNVCVDSPGGPVLGTMALRGRSSISSWSALPEGVIAAREVNGRFYGLTAMGALHSLGVWPSLVLGPVVSKVVAPADADAGVYLSGYIAAIGSQVLTGYTGAMFNGKVAVTELGDGGVRFINARGNYNAAALDGVFIINGLGLGSLSGTGVYGARPSTMAEWALAGFDSAFGATSSGAAAVSGNLVLLLGYGKADFSSEVRGIAPSVYTEALAAEMPLAFTPASSVLVAAGDDIAYVDGFENGAIVVRGSYDMITYAPYTTKVERIPLVLSSSNNLIVGQPVTMLEESAPHCTRAIFTTATSTSLYIAVEDTQGRRLLKLVP